jgi:CPA2 family monovalent cation:H+ antiporter-2
VDAHAFIVALTIVLGVAAVTTVMFQLLHQPVVLGYVLAGFIIGPNVPIPLVADRQIVQTLSELGIGEFSFIIAHAHCLRRELTYLRLGRRRGLHGKCWDGT